MGIIERIYAALSPRTRLIAELAAIAGHYEALAVNLRRHADECAYPNIKAGLARLAASEEVQANKLRELLRARGASPRLADLPLHDGSSNWERLKRDLELQVRLVRDLNLQVPEWAGIDAELSARLREFAAREDRNIGELRDLTLKCDPQALD